MADKRKRRGRQPTEALRVSHTYMYSLFLFHLFIHHPFLRSLFPAPHLHAISIPASLPYPPPLPSTFLRLTSPPFPVSSTIPTCTHYSNLPFLTYPPFPLFSSASSCLHSLFRVPYLNPLYLSLVPIYHPFLPFPVPNTIPTCHHYSYLSFLSTIPFL